MWMMLQCEKPEDYILATNETHSVREFAERAFSHVGITLEWRGERGSVEEIGVDATDESKVLMRIDPKYFRPTEVDILIGNPAKAKRDMGWEPRITFEQLVREMVDADLAQIDKGRIVP
jgi:GDPmannose 4,6-dehydratase